MTASSLRRIAGAVFTVLAHRVTDHTGYESP
jgi:hypothetical protein